MLNSQLLGECSVRPVFFPMENVIQNYAWGSKSSLCELFGIANDNDEPQAEIWMGAHSNGCSKVKIKGVETLLSELIQANKNEILGDRVSRNYGELPFLFKVLCAGNALSIQVHPNKAQAELGFKNEELLNIPLNAFDRNFKDPNHKPELVYALTEYQAMNGFRSIEQIKNNFELLAIPELLELLDILRGNPNSEGLKAFFSGLLSLEGEKKEMALLELITHAQLSKAPVFGLIMELNSQYPRDIGLFAPLILNVITLKPGEAMYLDAETPHAYLKGTGLEVMANSDNVLRAGLTPKYIDVSELVSCTVFKEKPFESLLLEPIPNNGIDEYCVPVSDFKFAVISNSSSKVVHVDSAEVLFAIDDTAVITHSDGDSCVIKKGESVFVPAYAKNYTVSCKGRVARAYC